MKIQVGLQRNALELTMQEGGKDRRMKGPWGAGWTDENAGCETH